MYQLLNITDEQDPLAVLGSRHHGTDVLLRPAPCRAGGLNLADVKLDERQLRVIGKGSRERVLPIRADGGGSGCTSGSRYAPAGR